MNINVQDLCWLTRWKHRLAPGADTAATFAFQQKLIKSQGLTELERHRLVNQQLAQLLSHCRIAVPYYRNDARFGRLSSTLDYWRGWESLPVLKRAHLQPHSDDLLADSMPTGHQIVGQLRSSGSTGTPIELRATNVTALWQRALAFRSTVWFRRNYDQTLGVIRKFSRRSTRLPDGETDAHWADLEGIPFVTGERFGLEATAGAVSDQLDWLERKRPAYLMTLPSVLRELVALSAMSSGDWAPGGVTTLAETVDDELRESVRRHWGTEINDTYSAEECGVIAVQCPSHGNYHIQSESLLVEIVDDEGARCAVGEEGRVVITTLTNFATPLIRYDIGDRAIAGETCGCGRNLPVLTRVLGRERNLLVTGNGKYWPSFGLRSFRDRVPLLSQQFRQTAIDTIEMDYTSTTELSDIQKHLLKDHIQRKLPTEMNIVLRRVDQITRGPAGKAEIFICEIADD